MEVKKINENTIRVLLETQDLTERGITVLDLLGNQEKIEEFFRSILDEVDKEHSFSDTDAVTFQVMPNRNGLELLIMKPTQDSQPMNGMVEEDTGEKTPNIADYLKEHIFNDLSQDMESDDRRTSLEDDGDGVSGYIEDGGEYSSYVIKFASFDDYLALVNVLQKDDLVSNLYLYQGNYYLELVVLADTTDTSEEANLLALAHEYGQASSMRSEVLYERGKVIMEKAALQVSKYYFLEEK